MGTQIKTDLILQLNSNGISNRDMEDILIEIQNSINRFNLKKMVEWEGNHNADLKLYDEKIQDLRNQKSELLCVINSDTQSHTVNISKHHSDMNFDA